MVATKDNTERYRKQLDQIGFSYDWSREVQTSDPYYYKWTQWIFKQLFNSYYCKKEDKALPISDLIAFFENKGNINCQQFMMKIILYLQTQTGRILTKKKRKIFCKYRLKFLSDTWVNWCEGLGTVLK